MEILLSKIEKHGLIKNLRSKFTEYKRKQLYNRSFIPLYAFVEHINFESIGYTFEDCLVDYEKQLKKQKEKYIEWKIWNMGYSVHSYENKNNISTSFQRQIREGIDYNSEFRGDKYLVNLLELDLDLTAFDIVFYDTHIELFGEEDKLIEFRDKFNLRYDVIWEREEKSYHLAFTGILEKYIRKDQGK